MNSERKRFATVVAALCCLGVLAVSPSAFGAFMYKKYAVKYDQGYDILCEPYVVKRNDWILKVFKRKGEISYHDFRVFLQIFKRVNPHVKNVNQIRPGEYVLIPLRKIPLDSLPGQSTGTVTIPFVTLSKLPENAANSALDYIVSRGDTVSALISRHFGDYGTQSYQNGLRIFQRLNPQVKDLDLIFAGQKIMLPSHGGTGPSGQNEFQDYAPAHLLHREGSSSLSVRQILENAMRRAADALGAELLDKGVYYFPGDGGADASLDLARYPVMVFPNGSRILFQGAKGVVPETAKKAASFWKKLQFSSRSPKDSADRIITSAMELLEIFPGDDPLTFRDHGVSISLKAQYVIDINPFNREKHIVRCVTLIDSAAERTPHSIVRYLEQHGIVLREVVRGEKAGGPLITDGDSGAIEEKPTTVRAGSRREFAAGLIKALGLSYTPGAVISFPYAGIQVEAVTDLISTREGTPVFVDFGDLHGEAVDAVLKSGFTIVQILPGEDLSAAVPGLLNAAGVEFVRQAAIDAAVRKSRYNISLILPDYMITKFGRPSLLLTDAFLPIEIRHFLQKRNIGYVHMDFNAR